MRNWTAGNLITNRKTGLRSGCSVVLAFFLLAPVRASFSQTSSNRQATPPATITLRVIVVDSEADAQRVLGRLKNGEDFGVIAKSKSMG